MEAQGVSPSGTRQGRWAKLPTWAKWVIGIVSVLLLLGIGAAIGSGEEDSLKSQVSDLEAEVASADRQRKEAEEESTDAFMEVDQIKGMRSEIVGKAREQADKIVGDAKAQAEEMVSIENEIQAAEDRLASVESSIGGAKEEAAKSTIADGIWQAESDYIPGTYRAPGGPTCYWATLNSADPYDIASNENGTGSQIASIESPYFQTKGCGTWERISE